MEDSSSGVMMIVRSRGEFCTCTSSTAVLLRLHVSQQQRHGWPFTIPSVMQGSLFLHCTLAACCMAVRQCHAEQRAWHVCRARTACCFASPKARVLLTASSPITLRRLHIKAVNAAAFIGTSLDQPSSGCMLQAGSHECCPACCLVMQHTPYFVNTSPTRPGCIAEHHTAAICSCAATCALSPSRCLCLGRLQPHHSSLLPAVRLAIACSQSLQPIGTAVSMQHSVAACQEHNFKVRLHVALPKGAGWLVCICAKARAYMLARSVDFRLH